MGSTVPVPLWIPINVLPVSPQGTFQEWLSQTSQTQGSSGDISADAGVPPHADLSCALCTSGKSSTFSGPPFPSG